MGWPGCAAAPSAAQPKAPKIGSTPWSYIGLGCAKTQIFEKRRELFFSNQAKANPRSTAAAAQAAGTACHQADIKQRRYFQCDSLCTPSRSLTARLPPRRSAAN